MANISATQNTQSVQQQQNQIKGAQAGANKEVSGSGKDKNFKEVWKDIQNKMGNKPEPKREVSKELDQDDYMEIMINQMKHQDPTKPMKSKEIASQISKLSNIRHMKKMNQALSDMTEQDEPLKKLTMSNLIGKTVKVNQNQFNHEKGEQESLSFNLPQKAKEVSVSVLNQKGEPVFSQDMGALKEGKHSVSWDGLHQKTKKYAEGGQYSLEVNAKDQRGTPIKINTEKQATVQGVNFAASEPVLIVGEGDQETEVKFSSVKQIVGENAKQKDQSSDSSDKAKKQTSHQESVNAGKNANQYRAENAAQNPRSPAGSGPAANSAEPSQPRTAQQSDSHQGGLSQPGTKVGRGNLGHET